MTPVRTEAEAVADALIALLVARKLDPTEARQCCDIVGISPSDLTDARIRYDLGRARKPRPVAVLRPVGAEDFSENVRGNGSGATYKESNGSSYNRTNVAVLPQSVRAKPQPAVKKWCPECRFMVPETQFDGFSRCFGCRSRTAERVRRNREIRRQVDRKFSEPIRNNTTVHLSRDSDGEIRLELRCIKCGDPVTPENVGSIICRGCC